MIRKLLATTAIATLVTTGAAMAQTTTPAPAPAAPTDAPAQPEVKKADGYLASNIIGETVYNGTGEDAENIGEVNDIVLDAEGNIQAIVVGVGGFLGIGEKHVALEYDLVEWTEMDGEEYIVVETTREALEAQQEFDVAAYEPQPADAEVGNTKPATAEDLANAPVEEEAAPADDTAAAPADDAGGGMAAAPADDSAATEETDTAAAPADDSAATEETDTAAAPADDSAATEETDTAAAPADDSAATEETDTAAAPADDSAAEETDTAAAPADDSAATEETDTAAAPADDSAAGTDETQTAAIDRSTLNEVPSGDIAAEDFVGTTVYGADDENIGEIGDVILSQDGAVEAVIIDVGGFLGVGEKQVAVGMENLAFLSDEEGNMYLYTEFTQEQLEAQAAYDESTYAENRDEQLLMTE